MVFRLLFNYLLNNTQLIEKLANSYPIRRAAQLSVYLFHRSKAALEDPKTMDLKNKLTEELRRVSQEKPIKKAIDMKNQFTRDVKKEWENLKDGRPGGKD